MHSASTVIITGQSPSSGATANPIWGVGGATSYVQLTTGTALEVVSSSANDAAAGTGARTVMVVGVDGNYLPFTETITLNGTTPVPLVNTSVIGINKCKVLTAGSGLKNAGNIDVRAVSGSLIKRRISSAATAVGQCQDFIYTIPDNQYGFIKTLQVYASGLTGNLLVNIFTYNSVGVNYVEVLGQHSLDVTGFASGEINMSFGRGIYVPKKTLIVAIATVSASTALVSAHSELELHAA